MKTISRHAVWMLLLLVVFMSSGVVLAEDGGDGEVAPQSVDCYWYYDLGDLPDGYGTLWSSNGAAHGSLDTTSPTVRLGSRWDHDPNGVPRDSALGDDTVDGWDDEDGVSPINSTAWTAGGPCNLQVIVQGGTEADNRFAGWIDWNGDGFQLSERLGYDLIPSQSHYHLAPGTHTIALTCPSNFNRDNALYARFRLYTTSQSDFLPTGSIIGGEVEDYKWTFATTAVTFVAVAAKGSGLQVGGLVAAVGILLAGTAGVPAWIEKKRRS